MQAAAAPDRADLGEGFCCCPVLSVLSGTLLRTGGFERRECPEGPLWLRFIVSSCCSRRLCALAGRFHGACPQRGQAFISLPDTGLPCVTCIPDGDPSLNHPCRHIGTGESPAQRSLLLRCCRTKPFEVSVSDSAKVLDRNRSECRRPGEQSSRPAPVPLSAKDVCATSFVATPNAAHCPKHPRIGRARSVSSAFGLVVDAFQYQPVRRHRRAGLAAVA